MMREKFYFSAKDAAKELQERQDSGVKEMMEDWWKSKNWPIPNFPNGNFGILARSVATTRYEDLVFAEMARAVSLQPLWLEYIEDKFVSISNFKRSLIEPFFCSGKGRNGGWCVSKVKLASIPENDGRRISDIQTGNTSLVEYHRNLQKKFIPEATRKDMSEVLMAFNNAKHYYPAYLSWFVAHGVLFEDYHGGESGDKLSNFTKNIFQPSWEEVHERIGLKPLIVPMPWWDGMQYFPADHNWLEHGVVLEQSIEKLIT